MITVTVVLLPGPRCRPTVCPISQKGLLRPAPGFAQPAVEGDAKGVQGGLVAASSSALALVGGAEALQRGDARRDLAASLDSPVDPGVDGVDGIGDAADPRISVKPRPLSPMARPETGSHRSSGTASDPTSNLSPAGLVCGCRASFALAAALGW